jgi:RNA polymerase sigma-70 factor (ECF subfamily)
MNGHEPAPEGAIETGELVVRQIPRLRRYARALVGDRSAADDLVQDTLERALSRLHLWRTGSDLRAWLFSIMHNVFVNQIRSRNVRREQALGEAFDLPGESGAEIRALELRDIDRALQRIPSEQREVVLLVGLEQLTYDEAANALGVPIGTIMSRLSRGRDRLRQLLGGSDAAATLKVVK